MLPGLSVVVPIYNEREGVRETAATLHRLTCEIGLEAEIILVDDGSDDGTTEILEEYVSESLSIVRHKVNKGYGGALKSGIRIAQYDYVAITDADGTYPTARIPELFSRMVEEDADMIVGARTGKDAKIPLLRRPAKFVLAKLANYLAGMKIPDINSGMRIMKKTIVNEFMNILPNGFSFTTTITLCMLTRGYHVLYEPIEYAFRSGVSKIRPVYDTLNFLQLIVRTVMYFNPLKIFLPVSLFFLCVSGGMILHRLLVARAFGVTAVVFFICGMQLLGLGMLADLFDKRIGR
jgi:glycosyltransferase involved in cell wall biosynthesis